MIVWRGWGLLALILGAAINVGIEQLTDNFFSIPEGFKHYRDAHTWWWFIGMLLSAMACWFTGLALEKRAIEKARVVTDKETGQELHLLDRHDMFWIPVKWWSLIYLGVGVWFWAGRRGDLLGPLSGQSGRARFPIWMLRGLYDGAKGERIEGPMWFEPEMRWIDCVCERCTAGTQMSPFKAWFS